MCQPTTPKWKRRWATAHCRRVAEDGLVIVPIPARRFGMVPGFQKLLPFVRVGHIGLARNEETHEPEAYYYKMPPGVEDATVIVVDPMLATGGSACDAIATLKTHGVTRFKFVCLIASEAGIARLSAEHPDVEIYAAECDPVLNDDAYIVPGLGDAGRPASLAHYKHTTLRLHALAERSTFTDT